MIGFEKVIENFTPVVDSRQECDQEDILKRARDYVDGR